MWFSDLLLILILLKEWFKNENIHPSLVGPYLPVNVELNNICYFSMYIQVYFGL